MVITKNKRSIMKKYIYNILAVLLAATVMTSCAEEEGTNPGNDSIPSVMIYQYTASDPYNPDNDTFLRLAANSATQEAYYLAEATATMEENLSTMGEEGYMNYVIENGTKVDEISGASTYDLYLTGLTGNNTITVVAVSGNKKTYKTVTFIGLSWEPFGTGYWVDGLFTTIFQADATTVSVELERAEVEGSGEIRFRFSSPYARYATAVDEHGVYDGFPYNDETTIVEGDYTFTVIITSAGASIVPTDMGMDQGYGMFSTGTLNGYVSGGSSQPLGTYDEEAGCITFPVGSLYVSMADYQNGGLFPSANPSYLYLSSEAYLASLSAVE